MKIYKNKRKRITNNHFINGLHIKRTNLNILLYGDFNLES